MPLHEGACCDVKLDQNFVTATSYNKAYGVLVNGPEHEHYEAP